MFDLIDRIVSLDIGQRGITNLYKAARARSAEPLCSAAARSLLDLKAGEHVMLITGSICRGWVSPELAETDGPIGTAALARVVSYGFNAIPVILTDPSLVKCVSATLEMAGLTVVGHNQAQAAVANERFTSVAVVETCGSEHAAAQRDAKLLHDRFKPRAVICIERAGITADGTFRNSIGQDFSAGRSRLDYVVREAQARGVPTIGVGDGGNEIGMGAIRPAVEQHIHKGKIICADVGTDVVFPVGVSNWGCYAIQAALAILTQRSELAHTAALEKRLLEAAPRIGLVDGFHGKREPTTDGLPTSVSLSIASLLEVVAQRGIAFQKLIGPRAPVYEMDHLTQFRKLM